MAANKTQKEFVIKNLVRSALVGIGTVGISHISYFKDTFGESSANMEYFLGGVAALLIYDRDRRHTKKDPTDRCLSDRSVKTLSELFQLVTIGTSFWYNPKYAASTLGLGLALLTVYKGINGNWDFKGSCRDMLDHLSCYQFEAKSLKSNNNNKVNGK